MVMNPTALRASIITKIEAATGNILPDVATTVWQAVAEAVIEHIVTFGQVTVAVASVSGVTTGPGVSGPGAGTGIIS